MIGRWWGGRGRPVTHGAEAGARARSSRSTSRGRAGWSARRIVDALAAATPEHEARLLPGFDPFTNELPRRIDSVLGAAPTTTPSTGSAGWVTPIVVIDGRVAGTWELVNGKAGAGTVAVRPFGRWRGGARKELAPEVERIAAFLDRPLRLEVSARR